MNKLLFIYPTIITEAPMTLAMLSSVAKQEGWDTKACINTFKRPLTVEDFVNFAKNYDADLIGIPLRIVLSSRTMEKKGVEWKERDKEETKEVKLEDVVKLVKEYYTN